MSRLLAEELFRRLDREVWLVTAADGDRRAGLIATSVTPASIVPTMPRVIVGISHRHETWKVMQSSGRWSLQLLPADRLDLIERFGMHSSRDLDKFADLPVVDDRSGAPLLAESAGWLDCRTEIAWDIGDRTFFLGAIVDASPPPAGAQILTTHILMSQAPRDWLSIMKAQLEEDAAYDEPAIEAWRRRVDRPVL